MIFLRKQFLAVALIAVFIVMLSFLLGDYIRGKKIKILRSSEGSGGLLKNVSKWKVKIKIFLCVLAAMIYGCLLAEPIFFTMMDMQIKSILQISLIVTLIIEQLISRRSSRLIMGFIKR